MSGKKCSEEMWEKISDLSNFQISGNSTSTTYLGQLIKNQHGYDDRADAPNISIESFGSRQH